MERRNSSALYALRKLVFIDLLLPSSLHKSIHPVQTPPAPYYPTCTYWSWCERICVWVCLSNASPAYHRRTTLKTWTHLMEQEHVLGWECARDERMTHSHGKFEQCESNKKKFKIQQLLDTLHYDSKTICHLENIDVQFFSRQTGCQFSSNHTMPHGLV